MVQKASLIWHVVCGQVEVSPVPANSVQDIELEEKTYKADFEIATKFQSFSKELLRIAFIGLGVIGILVKLAIEERGHNLLASLQEHRISGILALGAFAVCAASSLFHVFLTSRCLFYQLNILRHLGRLKSDAWDEHDRKLSRAYIERQREEQKCVIKHASRLLLIATSSLACGAVLIAYCATSVLIHTKNDISTSLPPTARTETNTYP